jgi:uncharacterized glyoxalase superfamily protein PhnB
MMLAPDGALEGPAVATQPAASRSPEMLGAHPQIFVTDFGVAVTFYRDRLGFAVEYLYGDPPHYGLVRRDGVALNLRHVDTYPIDVARRDAEDLLAVSIVVRDASALFHHYRERGIAFAQPYREQPWGAHDFIVTDPDGNRIHFASRVGEA